MALSSLSGCIPFALRGKNKCEKDFDSSALREDLPPNEEKQVDTTPFINEMEEGVDKTRNDGGGQLSRDIEEEKNEVIMEKTRTEVLIEKSKINYNAVIKVLDENIDKRLSVSQIAKLCNMSAISLQKTFSRFANMGVMEYFNRIKIKAAKKFFEEGLSVKEVAMSLGFEDPNYFSTVFKRITGNSPNKVRKKDK